jgi:hypothetical protein
VFLLLFLFNLNIFIKSTAKKRTILDGVEVEQCLGGVFADSVAGIYQWLLRDFGRPLDGVLLGVAEHYGVRVEGHHLDGV